MPNTSCWNKIFSMTASGSPTTRWARGCRPASNCSRVMPAQPRSRPMRPMTSAYGGKKTSAAVRESAAMKPWELIARGGRARPAAAAARA